jgi:serine/threonine-protein kinase
MAPEQLAGAGVTRGTDVYAVSVLFWEALTGAKLITGESELDLIAQLIKRQVRPPSQLVPDIPPALEAVVMRGLEAMPQDRFATAREMCMALAECGLAEAPSIAVGEWVQTLAVDALAERSAKITAIETRRGDPRAAVPRGMLSPSTRPPADSSTLPEFQLPPAASTDEPHSEVLSLAAVSPPSLRGGKRPLARSGAALLALLVVGVVGVVGVTLLIGRIVSRDVASTPPALAASAASALPPAHAESVAAPSPPPVPTIDAPAASSAAAPAAAASLQQAPARQVTRRPASRTAAASGAPAQWQKVFDSRE